jgi:phosphoribosylpyrophosphate synthetase
MEQGITVFAGPASSQLGAAVCDALQVSPGLYECRRFPTARRRLRCRVRPRP